MQIKKKLKEAIERRRKGFLIDSSTSRKIFLGGHAQSIKTIIKRIKSENKLLSEEMAAN